MQYRYPLCCQRCSTPVNFNTADAKTISESLSGIGPKKSEAIVKYRVEKVSFKTSAELANVADINEKTGQKNIVTIQLSLSFRAKRGILWANHAPALIRFLPLVEMTTKSSFVRKGAE